MSLDREHLRNAAPRVAASAESVLDGRLVEPYRALRAVIEAAGPGSPTTAEGRTSLVVLVVGVEHGASDVGIRLAVAFADGGRSTFLVDADLRAQGRHRLLRPEGRSPVGIADWLTSESDDLPLPAYPSGLPNLTVLPTGGPVARSDPFSSERLPLLIETIRRERERAVVIAPPLGQSADALFLAPHADGTLLVVAPGKTGGPAAVKARDSLQSTGARLYGVVLGEPEAR